MDDWYIEMCSKLNESNNNNEELHRISSDYANENLEEEDD